jgi:hypothetical protein
MKSDTIAEKVYYKFSYFEGNQHIASEYALKAILKLIEDFKVNKILEVGLGIGAICDTVLEWSKINDKRVTYVGTENNDFCLNALKKNVDDYVKLNIISDLSEIKNGETFDLIIIDGSDDSLFQVKSMCHKNTIIFIEGGRELQVDMIKKLFPKMLFAEMISDYKFPEYGPFPSDAWCGGGKLLFPYPNFKNRTYHLKEKMATFIKRKKRNKEK